MLPLRDSVGDDMIRKLSAPLALLMMAPLPAMAQAVEVDGWWLAPVAPKVCQIATVFKGDTMTTFIASDTQPSMISLGDSNWRLSAGSSYQAQLSFDDWKTSRTATLKADQGSNGLWIIAAMLDVETSRRIRQARKFAVRVPDLRIDGAVTIPESALARLADCMR